MYTRHPVVPSKLGDLTLVAAGGLLTGVYFPRHWPRPAAEAFGPQRFLLDLEEPASALAARLF